MKKQDKTQDKVSTVKKSMPIWKHYLIAFSILVVMFTGVVVGWNLRSVNQSNVEAQAKVLVQSLKSAK